MLSSSRLHIFLDEQNGFTFAVLDGRELIATLFSLHSLKSEGLCYFRDAVLSTVPMISFLKGDEGLGLYLDSESPYFRFKIEANASGSIRTILFPEDFSIFPEKITGQIRFVKLINSRPYNSVLPCENISLKEIINHILKNSYQIAGETFLMPESDFSLLIVRLPPENVNKDMPISSLSPREYFLKNEKIFLEILGGNPTEEGILSCMKEKGVCHLSSKSVRYYCPCSKERMISGMRGLSKESFEELFSNEESSIEARCDYCKKVYAISKNDFITKN